ncbi:hypothetical protein HELRODRAFT_169238 [Helobdella robusta]|uniref:HAT C-terminal dimerisation domain-containing protein n=1 Tax=Helobdella robusta TaxID=6412 RepID=T1F1M1_HELRO|nr:hypothetical protein HELRODRAFT_169238 [Helobdella robusta]ESO08403.1 hypothetical protein HELRODRAFT_169238 [Helobdella robusta]
MSEVKNVEVHPQVDVMDKEFLIKLMLSKSKDVSLKAQENSKTVKYGFRDQKNEAEENEPDSNKIMVLMKTAKNLVAYCKRSNIQKALVEKGLGLKQKIVTRWDSEFDMLESIKKAISELNILLQDNPQKNCLYLLDTPLIDHLLEILNPIKLATKMFSQSKVPTIRLKASLKYKLIDNLNALEKKYTNYQDKKDYEYSIYFDHLKKFVAHIRNGVEEKLKIDNIHKAAMLLNPKFKKLLLSNLTGDELCDFKKYINSVLLAEFTGHIHENDTLKIVENKELLTEAPLPPSKKPQIEDEVFQCYFHPLIDENDTEIKELDKYIAEETPHVDAVHYWSSHKKYFKLREVSYFLFRVFRQKG